LTHRENPVTNFALSDATCAATVWRVGQRVAVVAEGLTLASLAFTHNTWWGPRVGLAGRSLSLILGAPPGVYAVAQFSAALVGGYGLHKATQIQLTHSLKGALVSTLGPIKVISWFQNLLLSNGV
jgi:hypothetical protein